MHKHGKDAIDIRKAEGGLGLRKKGESKPIEVTCIYAGEEEPNELLMRSFSLFISRERVKHKTI